MWCLEWILATKWKKKLINKVKFGNLTLTLKNFIHLCSIMNRNPKFLRPKLEEIMKVLWAKLMLINQRFHFGPKKNQLRHESREWPKAKFLSFIQFWKKILSEILKLDFLAEQHWKLNYNEFSFCVSCQVTLNCRLIK
jgi:hypothetical protein